MNMSIITNSSIDMNNINLNHSLSPLSTHKHDPQFFSVSGVNEHQIISENDIEYYSGSTNGHINHSTGYGTEESGQVNKYSLLERASTITSRCQSADTHSIFFSLFYILLFLFFIN